MPPANPFSLDGKTAVVAGASRGIGQAIAEGLARAGARTILAARSLPQLASIVRNLRAEGCQAEAMALDIASAASQERFLSELPDVDILINVAGTNIRKNFTDYTPDEYAFLMQTNLNGIVDLTRAVGKRMIERGQGGKVVTIGSLTCLLGLPYISVYTITKSALAGLTRALAAEWGHHNIQVNCIAPGFILTDLNRKMWEPPEMHEWLRVTQANSRLGTPEDVHVAASCQCSQRVVWIGTSCNCSWPRTAARSQASRSCIETKLTIPKRTLSRFAHCGRRGVEPVASSSLSQLSVRPSRSSRRCLPAWISWTQPCTRSMRWAWKTPRSYGSRSRRLSRSMNEYISAVREKKYSVSPPISVMAAFGSRSRSVSAAVTPATPLPMMT